MMLQGQYSHVDGGVRKSSLKLPDKRKTIMTRARVHVERINMIDYRSNTIDCERAIDWQMISKGVEHPLRFHLIRQKAPLRTINE
jgi:hypothetical protein